jgi:hypothetical protein
MFNIIDLIELCYFIILILLNEGVIHMEYIEVLNFHR